MPSKIVRKIMKSGGSVVVSLPPDWLKMFRLNIHDSIDMIYGSVVLIKPLDFKIDSETLKHEIDLIAKLEEI